MSALPPKVEINRDQPGSTNSATRRLRHPCPVHPPMSCQFERGFPENMDKATGFGLLDASREGL